MAVDFVVGPTGLPTCRFADWRNAIVLTWRSNYGEDADTRPETPDGLIVDTLALQSQLLGDAVQSTYANSFFRTSESAALDLILDAFGRLRIPAAASTLSSVWYGTVGTTVHDGIGLGPIASVVSTGPSNGERFQVGEGTSGSFGSLTLTTQMVVRINEATDGNTYSVAFGLTVPEYVAGPTDTVTDIADGLAADIVNDLPTYTATVPGVDPSGRALIVIENKTSGTTAAVGGSTTDPSQLDLFPSTRLDMSSIVLGPQVALAGTLITVETPAAGIEGVTTTADATIGRDIETDAEFRTRHLDQINVGGAGTPERIRAALLATDGVDEAEVFNNPTDVTVDGIPRNSFESVIVGSATDQTIAEVILSQTPAGIQSWGSITTIVTPAVGGSQIVRHTRGTERFLHLSLSAVAGEGFPTVGTPADDMVAAIVTYLNEVLVLGRDFYTSSLGLPIHQSVPGVASFTVRSDVTDNPGDVPTLVVTTFEAVAARDILRADSSRIDIVIAS